MHNCTHIPTNRGLDKARLFSLQPPVYYLKWIIFLVRRVASDQYIMIAYHVNGWQQKMSFYSPLPDSNLSSAQMKWKPSASDGS